MKTKEQRRETFLPSPLEVAQIAASLLASRAYTSLGEQEFDAAIKSAIRLYLRVTKFCHEHKDDALIDLEVALGVKTQIEQSKMQLRALAGADKDAPVVNVPQPKKFPVKLKVFYRLIVRGSTEADSEKRFRDFLKAGYTAKPKDRRERTYSIEEAEHQAINDLAQFKKDDKSGGHFNKGEWQYLGTQYLLWWQAQRSHKARCSARSRFSRDDRSS